MDQFIEFITNHWILFVALLIVTALLIQDILDSTLRKYKVTTPIGAVALLDDDNTSIIDVREAHEFAKGYIQNSINISYPSLEEKIEEFITDKNDTIIVTCKTGTQSPPACKKLISLGYQNTYLLKGGIQAWEDTSLPTKRKKKKGDALIK